jgi:hypothetical protein
MRHLLLTCVCLWLCACGGPDREPEETHEERVDVLDPMTDTMDRAKAVEELGRERKKAMDEALEEAEGRSPE